MAQKAIREQNGLDRVHSIKINLTVSFTVIKSPIDLLSQRLLSGNQGISEKGKQLELCLHPLVKHESDRSE